MEQTQKNDELVREGLHRVREACEYLRVSQAMLYKLMDAGELPFLKIGRARRIPHKALVDFAAQRVVVAKQ